ncbi:MAG: hypothetical protein JWQ89_2455 [Devosia sp.]|uniref:hypothetical protein n=1 Tax=Devosia sp. TaxID=1871048 RepID=UPI00262E831B|nr:hypothetical protein [Devosia sp.]MDB5540728.1 hypothetical protein [Devosia sp.]
MGIIEKVVVSDETMRQLEQAARLHGLTVEQEAARRIETVAQRPTREELLERSRALRASMPPQTTDSLTLLREDRDR